MTCGFSLSAWAHMDQNDKLQKIYYLGLRRILSISMTYSKCSIHVHGGGRNHVSECSSPWLIYQQHMDHSK